MQHLRYAGLPFEDQCAALEGLVRSEPVLMHVLTQLRDTGVPDAWIASGAIYNMVWNRLTGHPALRGIKDVDIIYFDRSDLSYEAEDRVIRDLTLQFGGCGLPVEIRNQARVHLWFPDRFGFDYPALENATQSLRYYASKTHSVAVRLGADDQLKIDAPFGLDDIFAFRITPNHVLPNNRGHTDKAARAKTLWPELIVVDW